ncbi:MAG: hypothetical protein GXZ06_03980 [Tissierellia bacterium]|nr:hypothetical protein [Tissierellia bacterium]
MNNRLKILSLLIILSFIISGCSIGQNQSQNENKVDEDTAQEDIFEDISLNVSGKNYDLLVRSEAISDAVVNLFGIDNATSIILNDKVAVGLEMAEGHELTEEVINTVINTVKEKDNSISEVLVSGDKKIFDDIESVIENLLNGKSYDDQVNKINNIIENIRK